MDQKLIRFPTHPTFCSNCSETPDVGQVSTPGGSDFKDFTYTLSYLSYQSVPEAENPTHEHGSSSHLPSTSWVWGLLLPF